MELNHELGILAADVVALGWAKTSHTIALTAALGSSPLCLTAEGLQHVHLKSAGPEAAGPVPAVPQGDAAKATQRECDGACQALIETAGSVTLAELPQPHPRCGCRAHSAACKAQPALPEPDLHGPAAQQHSPEPSAELRRQSRKRAQPEPAEPAHACRTGSPSDSCNPAGCSAAAQTPAAAAPACSKGSPLGTSIPAVCSSAVQALGSQGVPIHPEAPAWLRQQVAALGASFTGAPLPALNTAGAEAEGATALTGRRVAFVLLEDVVAAADARSSACMIRAGLHTGRCGLMRMHVLASLTRMQTACLCVYQCAQHVAELAE